MGKTRDLFKKFRDTKGTFHAKMGSLKDRNGMDLTEVEGIKKKWQEYTEELYKKDLHDPDNHDGVITLVLSLHGKEEGGKWKKWQISFSWVPISLQMVTATMNLKDACSLEEKLCLT